MLEAKIDKMAEKSVKKKMHEMMLRKLRIRPQFKLPDWLLLAISSFGGLLSSFPTVSK